MRSVSRLTFLWAMWISLSASAQAWTPKDRLCRALLISTQNRPVDTDGVANQFNKVQRIDGLPREVSKQIENALQLAPHSEVLAALVLEGEEAIAEYFGALEDEKVRVGVPVKKVSLLGRSGSGQFLGSIALGGWAVYTSVATLVATGLSYFAHADFLTTAIVLNAPGLLPLLSGVGLYLLPDERTVRIDGPIQSKWERTLDVGGFLQTPSDVWRFIQASYDVRDEETNESGKIQINQVLFRDRSSNSVLSPPVFAMLILR